MLNIASAIEDFRRARRRAALTDIMTRITGESADLLSYDEVRQRLKASSAREKGLQEVPLDAIIGSVNRYSDFTRGFFPKSNIQPQRWANVEVEANKSGGLPPIEVYQIGSAYFVRDGNHRVSVARQLGSASIQAYVTEVKTRVPLTPDTTPEDLILKEEYAQFMEEVRLNELRPEADLTLTAPGKYGDLLEHIAVHRHYMGIDQQREIPLIEAAAHWYDIVYQPVASIIDDNGILREFPERTEADLYLWIAEHQAFLNGYLQRDVPPEAAARDLTFYHSPRPGRIAARLGDRIKGILPNPLVSGPPPGEWRKQMPLEKQSEQMFSELLIPISGQADSWEALQQGIVIARKESARLVGLHVIADESEDGSVFEIKERFDSTCIEAGVDGALALARGEIVDNICSQARWSDMIVMNLQYPPSTQRLASLIHGFRQAIQRCPRPVLAVPGKASPITKMLLAYDGSPKSDEALFVSTYFAGKWQYPLVVISVWEGKGSADERLEQAERYLREHGVEASYIAAEGTPSDTILSTAESQGCDLLLMGGYGKGALMSLVYGSVIDDVLRKTTIPVLLCR